MAIVKDGATRRRTVPPPPPRAKGAGAAPRVPASAAVERATIERLRREALERGRENERMENMRMAQRLRRERSREQARPPVETGPRPWQFFIQPPVPPGMYGGQGSPWTVEPEQQVSAPVGPGRAVPGLASRRRGEGFFDWLYPPFDEWGQQTPWWQPEWIGNVTGGEPMSYLDLWNYYMRGPRGLRRRILGR